MDRAGLFGVRVCLDCETYVQIVELACRGKGLLGESAAAGVGAGDKGLQGQTDRDIVSGSSVIVRKETAFLKDSMTAFFGGNWDCASQASGRQTAAWAVTRAVRASRLLRVRPAAYSSAQHSCVRREPQLSPPGTKKDRVHPRSLFAGLSPGLLVLVRLAAQTAHGALINGQVHAPADGDRLNLNCLRLSSGQQAVHEPEPEFAFVLEVRIVVEPDSQAVAEIPDVQMVLKRFTLTLPLGDIHENLQGHKLAGLHQGEDVFPEPLEVGRFLQVRLLDLAVEPELTNQIGERG